MSDENKPVEGDNAPPAPRSLNQDAKISDLNVAELSALMRTEIAREVASQLGRFGGLAGAHVNSGPPGFVNGGGHANFDPASRLPGNPGNLAGAHVNSGPPGFVNGGGHANFDPATRLPGNLGNLAGAHVNSGPPGFVNGGGHANFDPASQLPSNLGNFAGSHVNSGPPGFVNGGGHANFDPATRLPGNILTQVTLPTGARVALPPTGPVDLRIGGMRIKR